MKGGDRKEREREREREGGQKEMEDKEGYRDGKTEREREGTEQKQSNSCTARRGQ